MKRCGIGPRRTPESAARRRRHAGARRLLEAAPRSPLRGPRPAVRDRREGGPRRSRAGSVRERPSHPGRRKIVAAGGRPARQGPASSPWPGTGQTARSTPPSTPMAMVTTPIAAEATDARRWGSSQAARSSSPGRTAGSGSPWSGTSRTARSTLVRGDGIVRTNLTPGTDVGADMAIQADGRIVVVGPAGSASRFALVRYRRGRSLDRTFATAEGPRQARRRQGGRAAARREDRRDGYGRVRSRGGPVPAGRHPDRRSARAGVVRRRREPDLPARRLDPGERQDPHRGDSTSSRSPPALHGQGQLDGASGRRDRQHEVGPGSRRFTGLSSRRTGDRGGRPVPHEAGPSSPRSRLARTCATGPSTRLGRRWNAHDRVRGGASAAGAANQANGSSWWSAGGRGDAVSFALARYLG